MRAIIDKVISPKETFRINQIVNAVKDNLVIDQNLNIYSVQDLTRKLAVVGQQGVTFRVVRGHPGDDQRGRLRAATAAPGPQPVRQDPQEPVPR